MHVQLAMRAIRINNAKLVSDLVVNHMVAQAIAGLLNNSNIFLQVQN
jgi:hypothetical protein